MKKALFFIILIVVAVICVKKFKKPKEAPAAEVQQSHLEEIIAERNYNSIDSESSIFDYEYQRYTSEYILSHYDCTVFDASFIYKHLPYYEQDTLSGYDFILVNKPHFYSGEHEATGMFILTDRLVIVGKNNTPWFNTGLTYTEKTLIHEMAHAIVLDSGNMSHGPSWSNKVEDILKCLTGDDELAKTLAKDIVSE